jgi:hypothetical protein
MPSLFLASENRKRKQPSEQRRSDEPSRPQDYGTRYLRGAGFNVEGTQRAEDVRFEQASSERRSQDAGAQWPGAIPG